MFNAKKQNQEAGHKPVITTEEIEALKSQILEQFWSLRQKEINLKQSLRDDITKIVEKLEHVLTELDNNL